MTQVAARSAEATTPRLRLWAVAAVFALMSGEVAEAALVPSETELRFVGLAGEPQLRTFQVTAGPPGGSLPTLTVIRHDLQDAQTGAVLASSALGVTSERDDATGRETFAVTVTGAKAGHYCGDVEVGAKGAPKGERVKVRLDVRLEPAAAVEAEASSKSLTVQVRQGWTDLGLLGYLDLGGGRRQPSVTRPVYLIQGGEGEARVLGARVQGVVGAGGQPLPARVLSAASHFPLTVTAAGGDPIQVAVSPIAIPSGEYSGTLLIAIAHQARPVQVPLKLQIKDGPLLPLAVLLLGILAGLLFGWWGAEGKQARDLWRDLDRLGQDLREGSDLQAMEREEGARMQRKVTAAIARGEPYAKVKPLFDELAAQVAAWRAEGKKMDEAVQALERKANALAPGAKVREGLLAQLRQVRNQLSQGRFESLDRARAVVGDSSSGLGGQVADLARLIDEFRAFKEAEQKQLEPGLDAADTLDAMRAILHPDDGRRLLLRRPGHALAASVQEVAEARDEGMPWLRLRLRRLSLSMAGLLVSAILYLFVLAVGWISLYLKSATFGADPTAYISLFLWGATVETVRGKAVTAAALKEMEKALPA